VGGPEENNDLKNIVISYMGDDNSNGKRKQIAQEHGD
jgi:hypothetical protein